MKRELQQRDFYREIVEAADDLIYTHDLEGTFTSANRSWEDVTGYTPAELRRMNIRAVFAPKYEEAVRNLLARGGHRQSSAAVEVEVATKAGAGVPVEIRMQTVHRCNTVVHIQGIARDVSSRKRVDLELEYIANFDYLTGLLNRRRFDEELQVHLAHARRTGVKGALLFLDLDRFKDVNDTFGHSVGDDLLTTVAQLLRDNLPETCTLARLGGDEFTIILPRCDLGEAERVANEVLSWLRNHAFIAGGRRLAVSGSIGITQIAPGGIATSDELLSRADMAMYRAKETGRNCAWTYAAGMDLRAHVESQMAWRNRISEALEGNLLALHVQPILRLHGNTVSQYEALVRLPGEGDQTVDASAFIQAAERFGLVLAIDQWVICRTIELLAECAEQGRDLILQANLSGTAMSDGSVLSLIRSELSRRAVDPSKLVVEVTESVAIADIHRAHRFVTELRALGCRFALDDFGVGFSSFYQLKQLDVDFLKIDGGFIRNLPADLVDQHLVRAIVEVARALGKETIAEFVADEETIVLLRGLGVDYAQGYHVGRPCEPRLAFGTLPSRTPPIRKRSRSQAA